MQAILLAAGLGTRLMPLTATVPKCLMPINGRPLLEYWFRDLEQAGVDHILLNTHHLADMVRTWIEESGFADRVTVVHEEILLGTAGTILHNRGFVKNKPVMLIHADNLCMADFGNFINAHLARPQCAEITMMTFRTGTPETCGIVELDELGMVKAFHEKVADPPGNLANAAVYIVEPTVLDFLAGLQKNVIDFSTEVLPFFLGKIFTFHNDLYNQDIGTADNLLAAQWEYPGSPPGSGFSDAWTRACERMGAGGLARFARCLADALHGEYIRGIDVLGGINAFGRPLDGHCPVVVDMTGVSYSFAGMTGILAGYGLPHTRAILFYPFAPVDFSSKRIYEAYRLKSFHMCANRN